MESQDYLPWIAANSKDQYSENKTILYNYEQGSSASRRFWAPGLLCLVEKGGWHTFQSCQKEYQC